MRIYVNVMLALKDRMHYNIQINIVNEKKIFQIT